MSVHLITQTIKTAWQRLAEWDFDDVLQLSLLVFLVVGWIGALVLFVTLMLSGNLGEMFGALVLAFVVAGVTAAGLSMHRGTF